MGYVRQQLATQAIGLLKRSDLLLAASEPELGLGGLGLLLVETNELGVHIAKLSCQRLRAEQCPASQQFDQVIKGGGKGQKGARKCQPTVSSRLL